MEKLFSLEYGIGGLCVLLTLGLFLKVAEFVWAIREKKESLSDQAVNELTKAVQASTVATQLLEHRLQTVETLISEVPKLKNDLRRFYSAIKELAGDRWPGIRDEIMKDGFNA